jgi:thymidylate synthase ThyX
MNFISDKPVIKLLKSFKDPLKNVVAAAKTCYSGKGFIFDDDIDFPKDEELIYDLFSSGHHTTFEHAYFQFAINNVSRQTVWSLLHSHPFYNSEQVSQRFTEVKGNTCIIPDLKGEEKNIYAEIVDKQYGFYKELIDSLIPIVESEYFRIFPSRINSKQRYKNDINKRCREIARYILPIGSFTWLYHTISLITLIRYFVKIHCANITEEEKYLVNSMVLEVKKCDPDLEKLFDFISKKYAHIQNEIAESHTFTKEKKQEFDKTLESSSSRLMDYSPNGEKLLADSIRMIFNYSESDLDDDKAISIVLDAANNKILSNPLVLTNYFSITRSLNHIKYTFKKKISHTADSQNQRHRTTITSRPDILYHDLSEPDYIIPELIKIDTSILKRYTEMMNYIWSGIELLRKTGVNSEKYFYLLPNAYPVRLFETGSLLNYHHKYKLRLCFAAQEEIWKNSIEEIKQIKKIHPNIGKYLLPPCSIRKSAGIIPYCSEGKRYCGLPVWKTSPEKYSRII